MSKKQKNIVRKPSKREKRRKIFIFFLVALMIISLLTAGFGGIALL